VSGHEARSLHKGGVKHDDQEDLEEGSNNLQMQELLLIRVRNDE
jgi:hypothetical protein